jgi:hypothetical protein
MVSLPRPPIIAGDQAGRGGEDIEGIVALEAVDLQHLDVLVADREPGAVDGGVRDDNVVGELGAEHHHLVEATAAVDRDRRIDVVLDLVLAGAGTDLGFRSGREAADQRRQCDALLRVASDIVAPPDAVSELGSPWFRRPSW